MRSFTFGGLRFEVLSHQRVMGEDFPRPDPGAISEWFEIDCFTSDGQIIDLWPSTNPHPHFYQSNRLTIGWVGREVTPVYNDERTQQIGTKTGADFRAQFWPIVVRQVLKAQAGYRLAVRLGGVRDGDLAPMPLLPENFLSRSRADAVRDLTGQNPSIGRHIPRGTTAVIDADFDSYVTFDGSSYVQNETATTVRIQASDGFTITRGQVRFPLTSITDGSTVSDTDIQFNVTSENVEAGEGVQFGAYNDTGDDDPDPDTAQNKYLRSNVNDAIWVQVDCSTTGSKTGDLGASADAVVQGNLASPDLIALGIQAWLQDSGEVVLFEAIENAGTDPATLTVVYTEAVSTLDMWYQPASEPIREVPEVVAY